MAAPGGATGKVAGLGGIGKVMIGGDFDGGSGGHGVVQFDTGGTASIGAITIGGSFFGGSGGGAGQFNSHGSFGAIAIKGNFDGGSGNSCTI